MALVGIVSMCYQNNCTFYNSFPHSEDEVFQILSFL